MNELLTGNQKLQLRGFINSSLQKVLLGMNSLKEKFLVADAKAIQKIPLGSLKEDMWA